MSLFFLLLSCHHGRVTSSPPPPAQPWAALRWEPVGRSPSWSVVGLDLDALEATARAARAMLAARTVEGLGDFPVILGRETVGWDSRRCLSTALPMGGHGECALAPYSLALTDAVWLYHPRWGSAVRPLVRGSAHDLTVLCLPTAGPRSFGLPGSQVTPIVALPGGLSDHEQCPNAPTVRANLDTQLNKETAWVRAHGLDVPRSRVEFMYDEPALTRAPDAAERLWTLHSARLGGETYLRAHDQISGTQVIVMSQGAAGSDAAQGGVFDLDGSGYFELEIRVHPVGEAQGAFDGDEDGRVDTCWAWEGSMALPWPSVITFGEECWGGLAAP